MSATPQQNKVVDCRNHTPLEIARCLIAGWNLFQKLWPEAISSAANLHNILPHKATPHSTPEELYFGSKPNVFHLCVFGAPAFVHIHAVQRNKLSPITPCALVRYDFPNKTYQCFDPITHRIHLSLDVEFFENPPPHTNIPVLRLVPTHLLHQAIISTRITNPPHHSPSTPTISSLLCY